MSPPIEQVWFRRVRGFDESRLAGILSGP